MPENSANGPVRAGVVRDIYDDGNELPLRIAFHAYAAFYLLEQSHDEFSKIQKILEHSKQSGEPVNFTINVSLQTLTTVVLRNANSITE